MRRLSTKWLGVVIAVVIVALAVGLVMKKNKELAETSKPAIRNTPVHAMQVKQGAISVTEHYQGKGEAVLTAEISSRITANVLVVHQREGDVVTQGDLLVELDDLTLANKLRSANADARSAGSNLVAAESVYETQQGVFERDKYLYENKAISREAYERSQSATEIAKSQVIAAREKIATARENASASTAERDYAYLRAPFSGVIAKRAIEPGEIAVPGKSLLTLQAVGQGIKVTAQVPQERAADIHAGMLVILGDGQRTLEATVAKTYPALGGNNLLTVEMNLPAMPFGLPSGSTIGVDFVLKQVQGMVVPVQAIVKNTKGAFVVVVDGNITHQIPVMIVDENDKMAVVTGLSADSQVVIGQENELMQLMDGKQVLVVQDGSEGN